ncbi:stage II sporulation protein D [Thermoactinomyces sp. CICC 10521]|uniref:stage II sporulation protein D n=1 Tax=Thermoactinomyces sp. CICC 10521 TaxID=2767426 RepID=UPI0018DBF373|nr:stage II sporulation protein D [Thermoactinomyces sp. CICC 10521]MBH8608111.1 stage II sporulation protein D [Thermoactinomyces sp. CICC 10521]
MHKGYLFVFLGLLLVITVIPAVLVWIGSDSSPTLADSGATKSVDEQKWKVRVFLTEEQRVVEIPLEQYVCGVVASEMPADFAMEALKAQALAARTYIVDRMEKGNFKDMAEWGEKAKSAYVTDTVQHQVYTTNEKLHREWGNKYQQNWKRISEAVAATKGEIITYQGKPIYAAFFSTSNGQTENSEDYFNEKYPYLRSVSSPWDEISPKFLQQQSMSLTQLIGKLEKSLGIKISLSASTGEPLLKVINRTQSNRVAQVRVGDKLLSGRKVREALNLPSSDFSWKITGDRVQITTKGYGHGVGMSQWGANMMAKQGKKVEQIIKYYYHGVDISPIPDSSSVG